MKKENQDSMTPPNHAKLIVMGCMENEWDDITDKEVKRMISSMLKEIKEDTDFWKNSKTQQIAELNKAVDTGYESRIQ